MRFDFYDHGQNFIIKKALERGTTIVAYAQIAEDEVCGWANQEGECLHYVYVKQAYRRLGIASELSSKAKYYSHETLNGTKFAQKMKMLYNPYYLFNLCLSK